MKISEVFLEEERNKPFSSYEDYTTHLFYLVDYQLNAYLESLKILYSTGDGGYKNVLYPDLEIACDLCSNNIASVHLKKKQENNDDNDEVEEKLPDDLEKLLSDFAFGDESVREDKEESNNDKKDVSYYMGFIKDRAKLASEQGVSMPLYELGNKLDLSDFAMYTLACAVLASTQTSYASVFQVISQNGSISAPTIESAARTFWGQNFTITGAFGKMSVALEQLIVVIDARVNPNLPFSTIISLDKRLIDYCFGDNAMRPDENYSRFFSSFTDLDKLDPIMANESQLEALGISYNSGVRLFSLWGDDGSGRKFFIKHYCKNNGKGAMSINCNKLFSYDFSFVEKALWAATRECILTDSFCVLDSLSYHDEEKEKFFGYLDLAFAKLTESNIAVFTISEEKIPLREATSMEFTQLELPTPNNYERLDLWKYYSEGYVLQQEVDLDEMATKFLFTAGKIKNALHQGKALSEMKKLIGISRGCLFEACYNQMKHELTQKATKIKATYTWDDIVMPPDQRQTLEYVCDQMKFRKQVYEKWDYNRKYPYGRGLSVLLFGAPGTGKTMCAQVLANALNLELYRVDLSKVIDKYVGETEKSISMIFREAKKCNVVLFFDECDTLFGKRTDSGGAGESAANNKTAHLLQEVEAYDGVTVLATNYKHNIDPAFFRRMKFIVEFQFPDPETRYNIWKATIPKNTPLADDVDIRFLADRFEFVGGNIKNCILNAAFLAAGDGDGKMVHMKHYLLAIKYEFVKTGKVFTRADFEPYASLLGL
ncbi:MAG: ATP-binding protein [Lachnospiraceae bacterium]|nr:ATP-binding protein [Lachnospiraceae bacterium]